ncbi:MAG: hypothetical protein ABI406_10375, partial [Ktedonobacteraceae bacterium]
MYSNLFIFSSRWRPSFIYRIACASIVLYLALMVTSCSLPGQSQAQPPDPRLKLFHILSTRILTLDSQ